MSMYNGHILLEGGALRGVFTAGVLDVLMQKDIWMAKVTGVSAGALTGINYVAGQIGRSARVNITYCRDRHYMGFRNLLRKRQIVNFEYMFGTLSSEEYDYFDKEAYMQSPIEFTVAATNCLTGHAEYFTKTTEEDLFTAAQASSSMPLVSKPILMNGIPYLDGGLAAPVPMEYALEQGDSHIVLVLTQDRSYRKKPLSDAVKKAYAVRYHQYPELLETLYNRPERYNALMDRIQELEQAKRIFVLRPSQPVTVAHMEQNQGKLTALYEAGVAAMRKNLEAFYEYMQ